MQDAEYRAEQIAAYGSTEQPAIAARMAPHLRLTQVGVACGAVGVVLAAAALATFPSFSGAPRGAAGPHRPGGGDRMLALCVIQLVVWRIAMASWRGDRPEDLHAEARLSWIAHLVSYPVALVGLLAGMAGSAAAGWTATSAVLLAFSLLMILAAQALAAVQFLRPSGPPGTAARPHAPADRPGPAAPAAAGGL